MVRYVTHFRLLALAAALLLLAPIRKGDLAGYDDAVYAHIAKAIAKSGDWIYIQSNGFPALEHPPGFVWLQAALFSLLGFSDFVAKLPSALCGVGTVLLVYWLTRRLLDQRTALVAMFAMLATPYFIKYSSHGMTDVPFTFLFTATVCAWVKARDDGRWYAAVAALAGYALLMRGLVGLAVPLTLALDLRGRKRTAAVAIVAAFLPLGVWYTLQSRQFGTFFWEVQANFLGDKFNGGLGLSLRRYIGVFEYAWMLLQSYWPWLPFTIAGLWLAVRERDPRLRLLVIWSAVMYAACAVGGSRVLRYLLPAYPAFAIFAAAALTRWISAPRIDIALRWIAPAAVVAAAGIAIFPPVSLHAEEIRPIATAVRFSLIPNQRFAFYDGGQPRFDETAQIQWYGDRTMWILTDATGFQNALAEPIAHIWVVDRDTYFKHFASRADAQILATGGHLVCVRIS